MSFTKLVISYLLTTLVFLIIDLTWLGFIAKGLYRKYLGAIISDEVNWIAAIIFYLLFIVGIFIFAIFPAIEKDSLQKAIVSGALFGFFTYATYELTNLSTIKGWPVQIVIIDLIWGAVLTGLVSTAGFLIVRYLK